eukprot:scaffold4598_cov229-Pinguiococcus_pyrenoidosus.AAC.1
MVALDDVTGRKGHLRSDLLLFAIANTAWKELVLITMRDEADAAHKGLEGEARGEISHLAEGRGESPLRRIVKRRPRHVKNATRRLKKAPLGAPTQRKLSQRKPSQPLAGAVQKEPSIQRVILFHRTQLEDSFCAPPGT